MALGVTFPELDFTIRDDGAGGLELFIYRKADGEAMGSAPIPEARQADMAAELCCRLARAARRR